ncbi:MAG: FecR family protein [Chitinophagaceae bacterium]
MIHYHSYYKGFNEDQFAADEYFQQWVLSPDADVDDFWQSYLNLYSADKSTITRARQLVKQLADDSATLFPLTTEEKAELKKNIFNQLGLEDGGSVKSIRSGKKYYWLFSAASLLAIAIISAYIFLKPVPRTNVAKDSYTVIENNGETREITLPDSSVVILNNGSSLKYNNDFFKNADREVFLEGNAFFRITKHTEHKQFIVHAKSIDITVLGTQFNVDARSSAPGVVLASGKVKITRPQFNSDALYMAPGEKIVLDTVQQQLIKTTSDTRLYSAWTEHKWNFRQTELNDIAELIHEYYGVTVDFKIEKHKKLQTTAVIPVTSLEELVHILSRTLHIDIQQTNNRLIIQ